MICEGDLLGCYGMLRGGDMEGTNEAEGCLQVRLNY